VVRVPVSPPTNLGVADIVYAEVPGYDVDQDAIDRIHDLRPAIVPLLSMPPRPPEPQPPQQVDFIRCQNLVRSDKTFTWGMQLIHGFLTDPTIRSADYQSALTLESVFVAWISQTYKLQHLVNQVIADFAMIMTKWQFHDKFLALFSEILENRYTFSQLGFLSTLYTFTVNLTFPPLLQQLQALDFKQDTGSTKIHIVAAFKIFAKMLSAEQAEQFLRDRVPPENPLLDYIGFLRQATVFFGDKHMALGTMTRNLLTVCDCPDPNHITFEDFRAFWAFVGIEDSARKLWKHLALKKGEADMKTIGMSDLLGVCSERRVSFMTLLSFVQLSTTVDLLDELPPTVVEVYRHFVKRFGSVIPQVLLQIEEGVDAIIPITTQLRNAMLGADVPQVLWFYRRLLLKIEKTLLAEKGGFPLADVPTQKHVSMLVELFRKAEDVSFALLNLS
jgi:hypothetical protein